MRYLLVSLSLIASLLFSTVPALSAAADITGLWQGMLDAPGIGKLPRVMKITKNHGTYDVVIHSTEESDVPIVTNNVTVDGSTVVMKFDMNSDPWMNYHRVYRAKLSSDGTSIDGRWQGGGVNVAMNYHRTDRVTLHGLEPKRDMYVTVDTGVKDEVLDWGGTGRPVMLLAGAGVTARGFRSVLPDLTAHYHVYSVTRRGFGNSSKPPYTVANYNAKRLGEDVLSIMNALHIEKPILIGHSLAGEELSYIGSVYPKRVAGLIYLDAGYDYAYASGIPMPQPPSPPPGKPQPHDPLEDAVEKGMGHFTGPIDVPILAIFANPHQPFPGESKVTMHEFNSYTTRQIAAFRHGLPNAKVIVIPNADHFVYNSNTAQVLNDIHAFVSTLPPLSS